MWQTKLPRGFLYSHASPEKQLTKKLWRSNSPKGSECLSCRLSVLITFSLTVQSEREREREAGCDKEKLTKTKIKTMMEEDRKHGQIVYSPMVT